MGPISSLARLAWRPYFRGKGRLVDSLPLFGTHKFALPWGDMYLDARNRHQREMAFGVYERPELDLVRPYVPLGGTALDIGANVGYYSTFLGSLVGSRGRVLAVEPHPVAYACLQRNLRINSMVWCEPIAAAASNRSGVVTLHVREGEHAWSSLGDYRGAEELEVRSLRLDDLCQRHGISHVDFVKIDVEGHEIPALDGLGSILTEDRPVILAEVIDAHQQVNSSSKQQLLEWLASNGYEQVTVAGWPMGTLRPNVLFLPASNRQR